MGTRKWISVQISSHLIEDTPEIFSEDDKTGQYITFLIKGKQIAAGYWAYLYEELSVIQLNQYDSQKYLYILKDIILKDIKQNICVSCNHSSA